MIARVDWLRVSTLAGALILAGLLWSLIAMAACARPTLAPPPPPPPGTPPPPPPPPPPVPVPAKEDPTAALRAQLAALDADRAALASRLRSAEAEARVAPLRALTVWAMWIGGLAAFAGMVGLVLLRVGAPWLPVGGRFCAAVAAAGLALAVAAAGLAQALPWLPVAGLVLLGVLVLGGLGWAAVCWRRGGRAAVAEWRGYANALPAEARMRLDEFSRIRQGKAAKLVDALMDEEG